MNDLESKRIRIALPEELRPGKEDPRKWQNHLVVTSLFLVPISIFALGLILFVMGPANISMAPDHLELEYFLGDVQIFSKSSKNWTKVNRKSSHELVVYPEDKIETAEDSEIDFRIPNFFDLRLKLSSKLEIAKRNSGEEIRFKLNQGELLGLANELIEKNETLQIETPSFRAVIPNASFLIHAEKDSSYIAILENEVKVYPHGIKEPVIVKSLEILKVSAGEPIPEPKPLGYSEWKALTEVRDLMNSSSEKAVSQLELRKKAGNFFKHVTDEGAFYQSNFGFASREFFESSEEKAVILKIKYDVYPQGSFAGVYFRTPGLDLSKLRRFSFQLKAEKGKALPEQLRIELKEKFSVIRGFAVPSIDEDWKLYQFDLNTQKTTPISEVVFVFQNSKVGSLSTNSAVYIKNLNIE